MAEPPAAFAGGEVLFTGGTDWQALGRGGGVKKKTDAAATAALERQANYPNIITPMRLSGLQVTPSAVSLMPHHATDRGCRSTVSGLRAGCPGALRCCWQLQRKLHRRHDGWPMLHLGQE